MTQGYDRDNGIKWRGNTGGSEFRQLVEKSGQS